MISDDGRYVLSFNGEIYNHRALRAELEADGCHFSSRCDTEVLLIGYARWGRRVLDRIRGMFAFAIWDAWEESLWLVRDPVGVKPLYYTVSDRGLVFASEIKAILTVPGQSRELDLTAFDAYLDLLYIPAPHSIYRGIFQLPPGHELRWVRGKLAIRCYWDAVPHPDQDFESSRVEPLVDHVGAVLESAIGEQLDADVPVGVLLSGGMDSSLVAAMAQRQHPSVIETFSLGFDGGGSSFDERAQAKRIASYLGSRHHEIVVDERVLDRLMDVVGAFDEPFGSPTALLTDEICRLARTRVGVVLSGDGGDEVFGGYPRYRAVALAERLGVVPSVVWRFLASRLDGADPPTTATGWKRRARSFVSSASETPGRRYASWVGYRSAQTRDALLTPALRRALQEEGSLDTVAEAFDRPPDAAALARASYADLHGFLPENVLRNSDRMSMRHGLELRVPLCDVRLVASMSRVRDGMKMGWGRDKRVLRRLWTRYLPARFLPDTKRGFNGPMGAWMTARLDRFCSDQLHPEVVRTRGLFNPHSVQRLVDEHRRGHRDHAVALWSLLIVEAWQRSSS